MAKPVINIQPTKADVAQQFAADLLKWVTAKQQFTIALSGGSTPKILFELLANTYLERMPWKRIHFFWGDERCVPPDDAESNYRMTYETLLRHIPASELNVYRIQGERPPKAEAIRYGTVIQKRVRFHNRIPNFDLVMLGLGADGHTASIFPDQIQLLQSNKICAVATHPESKQERVTLTGKVIKNADRVAFLVTSDNKAARVQDILGQQGDWMYFPAAHIVPEHGVLHWYMDEAASSLLDGKLSS